MAGGALYVCTYMLSCPNDPLRLLWAGWQPSQLAYRCYWVRVSMPGTHVRMCIYIPEYSIQQHNPGPQPNPKRIAPALRQWTLEDDKLAGYGRFTLEY